ncbi:MAG TPA: bifunctional phosphoribosylaminoimidazolecarboxamide formyltransferase/inosine monophosphate cyclohydrolase [Deltaproteobacteria bacterium]|nr:bifunctional phosphoribosylaminoimidazolecarboxamide formyltransferase/inosine monophosphate cyclohydrolase [Deltaproteobacteria bacterium]
MEKIIQRALLSVSDKAGILELAKYLAAKGVEILSTGGTEKLLKENGVQVVPLGDYTGFPEMMDGRVKTLHPKVHGGILNIRSNPEHQEAMAAHGIRPIDLVVVNLYPFVQTVAKEGVHFAEAIENVDIGGPSMLRAAAKNFEDVTVVVDPNDYGKLLLELENHGMQTTRELRFELAAKVFSFCSAYDGAISNFLTSLKEPGDPMQRAKFSGMLNLQYRKIFDLRYGENPHQQGAYYSEGRPDEPCVGNARRLHGKELSYNNILDLDGALETVKEFEQAACVIVKHSNPCGAATCEGDIAEAFLKAKACDEVSAFGGIIAFNREVSPAAAEEIGKMFVEAVIAPDYAPAALELLKQKKNIRLLKTLPIRRYEIRGFDMKKVVGGMLVQDRDTAMLAASQAKVVTKREPSAAELRALDFAWKLVKHVKSNAIVFCREDRSVGIGAGQMSRVDSVKIAALKAASSLQGAVIASDAFFPFRDGLDEAAKHGVSAVIQPGGSVRDEEVIAAADEHGIAMLFTGMRHFRH